MDEFYNIAHKVCLNTLKLVKKIYTNLIRHIENLYIYGIIIKADKNLCICAIIMLIITNGGKII